MLSREIYGTNKEAMLLPINGHMNDSGWKLPSNSELLILDIEQENLFKA